MTKSGITVWLPYRDAEFAAQKDTDITATIRLIDEWRVVHVASTRLMPNCFYATRKEALEVARRLSDGCPSAKEVRVRQDGSLPDLSALAREVGQVLNATVTVRAN